jgi:hypothetical protein
MLDSGPLSGFCRLRLRFAGMKAISASLTAFCIGSLVAPLNDTALHERLDCLANIFELPQGGRPSGQAEASVNFYLFRQGLSAR